MQKINLFFILAFKEQTYKYDSIVKKENNSKNMNTTLILHYIMLSKYFNLYNFYEYKDKIEQFGNAVIYHLPNGRDNRDTSVEVDLLQYKGKVPIVMRSYDAHSPLKLSSFYLDSYHDLALTYLNELVNNKNRLFAQLSYDNFLITKYDNYPKNRKFACIILRKENRVEYYEKSSEFKEICIEKTYHLREKYVDFKQIDIYGANWSLEMENFKGPLAYQKKHHIQNKYKFNFIIENAIVDNYLSEKIFDTFLSLSVPVYLGSPVVEKYIPKECFVDIRDFENNDKLIEYLEKMDDDTYKKYIENILKYRDELFEKFSTKKNFALPVYKWYKENYNSNLIYFEEDFDSIEQNIKKLPYKNLVIKTEIKYLFDKCKLYFQGLFFYDK